MSENLPFQRPLKTYAETDILKDSDIWDYLIYLQLNRINFLSTTIFDTDKLARNVLLNLISSCDQLEFLCWEKINQNEDKKNEYLANKPKEFKNIELGNTQLDPYINGDPLKQLQLKMKISLWLKCFDKYLGDEAY